jgi:hypothetical protein
MGDIFDKLTWGQASRGLPNAINENSYGPLRLSRRGENMSQPIGRARHALADEGTYFIAHNPTNDAATTLAGHPAPVLADADATMTKPFIHLRMDPAAGRARLSRLHRDRGHHGRRERHRRQLGGAARHGHHARDRRAARR